MTTTRVTYIAHGSCGTYLPCVTSHPRKELLDYLGRKHASRMFIDTSSGAAHIGYVIAGEWFTLYHVDGRGLALSAKRTRRN